jgi:hypothetical protein
MKEKKISGDWYIALTHFITSGIVIMIFYVVAQYFLFFTENKMIYVNIIGSPLLFILGLILGVIYSAKYITKAYVIKNSQKIAKLSTIYWIFLGGIDRLYKFMNITNNEELKYVIIGFIFLIIESIIFYTFSKKYIKVSENNMF